MILIRQIKASGSQKLSSSFSVCVKLLGLVSDLVCDRPTLSFPETLKGFFLKLFLKNNSPKDG